MEYKIIVRQNQRGMKVPSDRNIATRIIMRGWEDRRMEKRWTTKLPFEQTVRHISRTKDLIRGAFIES